MVQFDKKLVAVLNKNCDKGKIMNALAHMSLGLGASVANKDNTAESKNELRLTDYKDADNNSHKNISEIPFIVLEGNSNKIRELRKEAIANNIESVDFTNTMTVGTYEDQIRLSAQTKEQDLEYYGICLFGDWDSVSQLTKKFSLWK
ncbi:DUF2000 domain-containing protein [Candidatus Woesearchaeota archaeon]|nr:DUF2000 domain-containing protein [Candidatus Woesearchaeota archaeon]